ncbi:subclass B3 metallo-beta-lactamase [Sphingomonas hylomeconis]|uniref:Subclass B3 metallo-beta-lactamase n=1 Tax=Sphingomonas hylomeconis TaxID=1395958 RepID=A0ABV7SZB6_9SPHN|nr:subclass B3 metallo-beta-lactamase [Sphingomonas hylomeconis]
MIETRDPAGQDRGSIAPWLQGRRGCRGRAALAIGIALLAAPATAADPPSWTQPTAPFHLIGPVDYVGTEGLAAYLIHTSAGAILIDGTMAENAAAIERSVAARGVQMRDVKVLLLSHAHFDHAGGLAALKRASGAQLVAGAADRAALESGVPPGETSYGVIRFPAVKVDRAIRDGERVRLGGVTLTAVATPGHTPGCTSWSLRLRARGKPVDILFACSVTVAGNKLVGNRRYPAIVTDFRASLARLSGMSADIVLPFHPELADLRARAARDTLVDRAALPMMVRDARAAFDADLAKQRQ